ncbi:MAG TPA: signal peptide peptidase SppA [Alphaproteobacteria bacterium]|nr:signal peptide peptidase SppA [Alphaproteobacteria bacterium]
MRVVIRVLAVIGLLSILALAGLLYGASRVYVATHAPPPPIKTGTVLTLTVGGPFIEESPTRTGVTSLVTGRSKKLREIIGGIDHAATDSKVKGLVLKLDASAGMAQTQELRAAIKRFRAGGKFVYAFADDYGESAAGNGQYYLAAACDQIWLQPMGQAMLTDVMFEAPFLKDAFGKMDVDPEFAKRAEYKTAPETYTERGFTPAAREMMEGLANDLTLQLVTDVSASRNMPADELRAVLKRGPLTTDEALQAKLIDHVGYADEVIAAAKKAAGTQIDTVSLPDYYDRTASDDTSKANIALIYEVGEIERVGGPIDPAAAPRGRDQGNAVILGFTKAIENPSIKAIVFRVDSPGGSVTGSESLRRMVVRAKQAGKKVVVSMGAVAASGGYWISADADKIVAEPATLTGSIGVFSGKFAIGKGLGDLGITTDRTAGGPFAGMDSPFTPFTPEQLQRLNATIDVVYDAFVARVAEGRNIPSGTVASSAKGRVWSGQQAKQLGLVDSLGGLSEAIEVARNAAGIPTDQPTVIRIYPEPMSPFQTIMAVVHGDADVQGDIGQAFGDLGGPAGAAVRALSPLFRDADGSMARMPDLLPVR